MTSLFRIALPGRLQKIEPRPASPVASDSPENSPGYQAGFDAGYRAGQWLAKLDGQIEREKLSAKTDVILNKIKVIHEEMLAVAAEHLPEITLTALARVLNKHSIPKEGLIEEIKLLIEELNQAHQVVIECNEGDLGDIRGGVEALGIALGQGQIEWRAGANLKQGEYTIESDLGTVDGRRMTRLRHIREALEGQQS
jgi:flagellar biosynthesis/type III secretory pathway protein FliH